MKQSVKKYFHISVLALILALAAFQGIAFALHVPFKRIVFDRTHQSDTLTVINDTKEAQNYVLGFLRYRMQETGSLQKISTEESVKNVRWADDFIRIDPEKFTLAPGASRVVRIFLDPAVKLQYGEYRSHLQVRTQTVPDKTSKKTGMNLTMEGGIVMPVFIRQGDLNVSAEITNVKLVRQEGGGSAKAHVTLKRGGNMSLYGDFLFSCLSEKKKTVIKRATGIAVYTEVGQRNLSFNLDLPADAGRACPYMQVSYQMRDGGNAALQEVMSDKISVP